MVAPLRVGIAGLGTVGAEVVRLIEEQSRTLSERSGRGVRVVAVTARSKAKKRSLDLRGVDWAKSPLALANDPNVDCFVELMGGSGEPALSAIEAALKAGKSVVTANKALIAKHGIRLAKAAEKHGGALNFEAVERAIIHSIPKPIALIVCYPSNPTAYVAELDFYRDLVAFAKKHEIFILSDLAYAEVYFDDSNPPPSVLQVPGAIDVTVEFTSMSKTFSMAGWHMGFAVGNERIIAALARVKSYLDYGAFTPIQVAATAALNGPDDCIKEMRDTYRKRRDALVESFGRAGWEIPPPQASMFAWAPLPKTFEGVGSMQFATLMVEKSGVVVSPGVAFGEHGEGYVRIAMVENEQRIRQAARGVRRFLESGIETLHNVVPLANRR